MGCYTGQGLRTLSGHKGFVASVTFSPDGTMLASGSYDDTIKLWNVTTGQELRALGGDTRAFVVNDVAFSPDGRTLVSAWMMGQFASGACRRSLLLWYVLLLLLFPNQRNRLFPHPGRKVHYTHQPQDG